LCFAKIFSFLSLASEFCCERVLSLRWSETTEAIPLQATFVFGLLRYARNDKSQDRHTTFAMTFQNLPAVLAHEFCHCEPQQDFFAKPKCDPATSHTCGVVEAISLPVDRHTTFAMTIYTTLVMTKTKMATRHKASRHDKSDCIRDDNLYYARNDKNQDGHEA